MQQKGWNSERVWCPPILARGKLHAEVLAPDFPGEEPAGAPAFLAAVRKGVAVRFQAQSKPTALFLDRGRAFFNTVTAKTTPELALTLEGTGLEILWRVMPACSLAIAQTSGCMGQLSRGSATSSPAQPRKRQGSRRAQSMVRVSGVRCSILIAATTRQAFATACCPVWPI